MNAAKLSSVGWRQRNGSLAAGQKLRGWATARLTSGGFGFNLPAEMNAPRFFVDQTLAPGLVELDPDEARHAVRVLRLRDGADVLLFDGRGQLGHGRLEMAPGRRNRGAVHARLEQVLHIPPPSRRLELLVAPCKGPRLSWMIEKLTELGVATISLTRLERSVVVPSESHVSKLRRIAIEAAKQSQRAWLPEIRCAADLEQALSLDRGATLVATPEQGVPSLAAWLHAHALAEPLLRVIIGPEGGLTDAELERLREAGAQVVRLAEHILRVETAALCVAANWATRVGVGY